MVVRNLLEYVIAENQIKEGITIMQPPDIRANDRSRILDIRKKIIQVGHATEPSREAWFRRYMKDALETIGKQISVTSKEQPEKPMTL
jgi:hypothetical protein